jgi:hypothetical protein
MQTERSSAWPDMSSLKLADILLHSLKITSTGALLPINTFLREVHLKRTKFKKKFSSYVIKNRGFIKKTNQLNLVTEMANVYFYKYTKHINMSRGSNYLHLTFRTCVQYSRYSAVKVKLNVLHKIKARFQ